MTITTKVRLQALGIALLMIAWAAIPVYASGGCSYNCDDEPPMQQEQGQEQGQTANGGDANSGSAASSGSDSAASNDISIDDSSNTENNSSNIVLVPNNNTENCLRVFGIAWGKNGESGALGWPWRSKKCDTEAAADDAFAQGEREIGWFWKCENPNLYKSFKDKGESQQQASKDCLDQMLGGLTATTTITTLEEQLAFSENERRIARNKHSESVERLNAMCEESKDKIFAACVDK